MEVERVVALADLMVWVVDPQKYADAALHERYLRRFSGHGETMLVVLNQADRLDAPGTAACVADLGRLLAADGLPGLPVLALSARTGDGLAALRDVFDERVAAREAATARLAADVGVAVAALRAGTGDGAEGGSIGRSERAALTAALADAAGVPLSPAPWVARTAAAARSRPAGRSHDGCAASVPTRSGGSARPGTVPSLEAGSAPPARSSLPEASPVQRAQVETAARALADRAAGGLPAPWPALARRAALAGEATLPARLDAAVSGTDLKLRTPRWWRLAGLLQLLLAFAAGAGALWLLALAGLGYLRVDDVVPTPEAGGIPIPTLLLGGGVVAGLVLAFLAGFAVRAGARRRARVAERALRARVAEVAEEVVIAPVQAELAARRRLAEALAIAEGTRDRRAIS